MEPDLQLKQEHDHAKSAEHPNVIPSALLPANIAPLTTVPLWRVSPRASPLSLPKRFTTSYIYFSRERYGPIKTELERQGQSAKVCAILQCNFYMFLNNVSLQAANVAKVLAYEWKNLTSEERSRFDAAADVDKERYHDEMRQYKQARKMAQLPARSVTDAPKRPASAYLAYSNERRKCLKLECPGISNAELSRLLARQWKELDGSPLKEGYIRREKELRQQYKRQMSKYRNEKRKSQRVKQQNQPSTTFVKTPAVDEMLSVSTKDQKAVGPHSFSSNHFQHKPTPPVAPLASAPPTTSSPASVVPTTSPFASAAEPAPFPPDYSFTRVTASQFPNITTMQSAHLESSQSASSLMMMLGLNGLSSSAHQEEVSTPSLQSTRQWDGDVASTEGDLLLGTFSFFVDPDLNTKHDELS